MKAALALIFFACVAGTMATDARIQLLDQLAQQGQGIAQAIFGQLQQQILALAHQAFGQLSTLIGSFGARFDFNFSQLFGLVETLLPQLAQQALNQLMGALPALLGGMYTSCFVSKLLTMIFHQQVVLYLISVPSSANSWNKSKVQSWELVNIFLTKV